ncbi:rasGAP-activating-like protein 1 [Pterocles gutturalis]
MAKTTSLRCRVLEGKDLPAKDVSGSSDPYCVVKVDDEVVARTATVWKSLNPFWGEEYTLRLSRGFRSLTIYVLDEDTIGQDDVIGKVSLSRQQIAAEPRGIDGWLSLAPVDPDEEVQGEIRLELCVPEQGHPRVLRCHLIEARRALQSIGNLGLQLGQGKEPWMAPLHAVLLPCVTRVTVFLDQLVAVEGTEAGEGPVSPSLCCPSAPIKEGYLHTRTAGGPALLPRFTFKKRYFWLSTEALTCSKSPEWQVRCSIPVPHMRAVERVDEGTFQHPHVLQIVAQDEAGGLHTTYIQCKSAPELWQWLWALREATSTNATMLPTCHPGTFRAGRWTCCLRNARTAGGCSRTHGTVALGEWRDPLDPAAAAQTLYGHLRRAGARAEGTQGTKGTEGSTEGEPPSLGLAGGTGGPDGERLQAVLRDLDIAHDAFARQDGPQGPPPSPPKSPSLPQAPTT